MSYTELYVQAREEAFLQKLTVAVVEKVKDQYVAGGMDMADASDVLAVYAGPRSSDFRQFAKDMSAIILAVNGALNSESTDAAFDAAVNAAWGPYASLAEAKGLITVEVA